MSDWREGGQKTLAPPCESNADTVKKLLWILVILLLPLIGMLLYFLLARGK